jgi:hypothetical protein
MRKFIILALGALALLAVVPAAASARTPFLPVAKAKAMAADTSDSYAEYRLDEGTAWDDPDSSFMWDDYVADSPKCTRTRRNVVDCKLSVTIYESAEDDFDTYTAKEDCAWTLRVRKSPHGVSTYMPGTDGGDYSSVECVGDYGDDEDA